MVQPQKATKTKSKTQKPTKAAPVSHGVGRRKSSVARVWLRKKGKGALMINGREYTTYFDTNTTRLQARKPFDVAPVACEYDVEANVSGGGLNSQADAIKLAVARALVAIDESLRSVLRAHSLLTSDSRLKERKKYGQSGARRKFQFVKR